MKNKYVGYAFGTALGIAIALGPELGEAFYVSQKEAQKAGIKAGEITKTKLPMGDKVSYKGHLEGSETFDDIAKHVHEWAEDFFGTNLSYRTTRKVLADFNYYRKVEMPSLSVPCKYQFMMNYIQELEKEIGQSGKPGPMEKDMEFLKGKLQELEELYEQDISELKEKYKNHDKRIEELEKRPAVKEYDRKSRLEMEDMEPEERLGSMEGRYAQPPVAGYGYGEVIFGQPGWFPFVPYPYVIWNGSIYCREYFGNTFRWRYWGMFDDYGHGFRARRHDGKFFDFHGPRSLFRDYYRENRGFSRDNFRGGQHPNQQFNQDRGHQQRRQQNFCDPGFKGMPRNNFQAPGRQQNFQGRGLNTQPRNFGNQGNQNFMPKSYGNRGSRQRGR
jgi:hypothetical protein